VDDPDQPRWLSPRTIREAEIDTELLGRTLREFRAERHLGQADLAQILNFDQSYISKIEAGHRHVRDTEILLHVARQLDLPPKQLGISDDALRPVPPATAGLVDPVDQVVVSQDHWRTGRRRLNGGRSKLAHDALQLYRPEIRSAGSPTLAPDRWLPAAPLSLDAIRLDWSDDVRSSHVTGAEPEAMAMLPLRVAGRRYPRYTDAIRYLDRPALFENRPSYRLLDLDLAGRTPFLRLGLATYFDKLDVAEALAHELAESAASGTGIGWAQLPFRSLVGDPFDLGRRPVLPAIETLTLRRNRPTGKATFLLHWRDPAKVATAAGIYGLVPAGEFQPSSIATHDRRNDFDMWRNIVREYSEELLGEPERDGSSGAILDYDKWPLFQQLRGAQESGQLAVHCLGVTIDPLTLGATILTVAVFDHDVFDDAFGAAVRVNAEGVLISAAGSTRVTDGLPFDESTVTRLLRDEPMAPSSSSTLERAWMFRDTLLGHA
jgi:transcriptional regulator with XRE-family HTH domain